MSLPCPAATRRSRFLCNEQMLTPGRGQDHVRVFGAGGDGGNPSSVSLEGALVDERFRHDGDRKVRTMSSWE